MSVMMVLYETLTGKLPFPGPNYLAQKRDAKFVPPSEAAPGLPKSLDEVVRRALQPDPKLRYQSAVELLRALGSLSRV